MLLNMQIALLGNYTDNIIVHQTISLALKLASKFHKAKGSWKWVATSSLSEIIAELSKFSAI